MTRYRVAYGPPSAPYQRIVTVSAPRTTLVDAKSGWMVAVKSLNAQEVASWDWVHGVVP